MIAKRRPQGSVGRRARLLGVAAVAATLSGCGGESGQAVQDEVGKQTTREFNRIVDAAAKTGREAALSEIDRLERAAKSSKPIEKAADRARSEIERRAP